MWLNIKAVVCQQCHDIACSESLERPMLIASSCCHVIFFSFFLPVTGSSVLVRQRIHTGFYTGTCAQQLCIYKGKKATLADTAKLKATAQIQLELFAQTLAT